MYCRKCGRETRAESKYCPYCGAPLVGRPSIQTGRNASAYSQPSTNRRVEQNRSSQQGQHIATEPYRNQGVEKNYAGASRQIRQELAYERARRKKKRTKRITVLLVIALFVVLLVIAGICARNIEQWRQIQQNYDAVSQYEALLQEASENYTADPDRAAEALEQAIALFPDRVDAYRSYAYMLYLNEQYADCVSEFAEIAGKFGDGALDTILASAYYELRDYSNAEELYRRAVENTEFELTAGNLRDYAVCLGRQGKLEEASAVLETLIRQGESSDVTAYVQGEICYAQKDYEGAEASFLTAAETDDPALLKRTYISLAETYRDSGDYEALIQLGTQASLAPEVQNSSVLSEMLGAAYYAWAETEGTSSDYLLAAQAFQKTIDIGIQSQYLFENVCVCYMQANEYPLALQTLNQMEAVFPNGYTSHALRAIVLMMEQNTLEESQRDYTEVLNEYNMASGLITEQDDHRYMQQLESLVQQLQDGGWIQ